MSSRKPANMADDTVARPAPPCTLVIFGVMGDLARRLLVAPALYNLAAEKLLPEKFALVGIARSAGDTDSFRQDVREGLREFAPAALTSEAWRWFEERLHYLRGDFEAPETYEALAKWLAKRAASTGVHNAVFYLATPPDLFGPIVRRLGQAGLTREDETYWRRVIIEKPFGTDLKSALALNREVLGVLKESQIYRIDHYLGKETVQNIMVLRFANAIFEPIWNRDHIDHVQITVAETVGVEHRGKFYDCNWSAGRHGADASFPAPDPGCDGAADASRRRFDAVREGQGAQCNPACIGRERRAWPVRRRYRQKAGGRGVSQFARCRDDIANRDVYRIEARDRQLALGGRAVLSAHRQIDDRAEDRDRRAVQARAARAVPGCGDRSHALECALALHSAVRDGVAEV